MAYCDDEIRGISELLDYRKQLGRKFYALMVYSNEPYEEGFRLYYQENAKGELIELDYGFDFESDMVAGDFMEPVMINLPQTDNDDVIVYTNKFTVYPNPFNPELTLDYQLAGSNNIKIEIYNIKGQKVKVLLNEYQERGDHSINWNAAGMNSGVYLIRFISGEFQKISKVVMLK